MPSTKNGKRRIQKMTSNGGQSNEEQKNQSLEENLPMVSYIMLHRIYDMLTLIANKVAGEEKTSKMIEYHEMGYLLGPSPSYTPQSEDTEE